jgi:sugar phosphate isomerase/epimerase
MTEHRLDPAVLAAVTTRTHAAAPGAPWWARAVARLRAGHLDAQLAVGVTGPADSPLGVHARRLTSRGEREAMARSLRRAVHEARDTGALMAMRMPLHRANVAAAEQLIDDITLRLHAPRPVGPVGMARLRRVLADGCGPLYRYGRGDLVGRLGAVLAEL